MGDVSKRERRKVKQGNPIMYAGLRYGLALYSSRVPALCCLKPRRPVAVLLRCRVHGAAEQQMEEEETEEGKQERQQATADRCNAWDAEEGLPAARTVARRPLQNGYHQNSSGRNGDAAPALPWDVLVKIPHPKSAESNGAVLPEGWVGLSKKDSPLARTLSSVPLPQSPVVPGGAAAASLRAPKTAGWSAEFFGDSDTSEGIGYGDADQRYDSFGRALAAPGQVRCGLGGGVRQSVGLAV